MIDTATTGSPGAEYDSEDLMLQRRFTTEETLEAAATDDSKSNEGLTANKMFAIISLSATFTASQIPSFLLGPGINIIADGLHVGTQRSWILVSGNLAYACLAPCAGYLQDALGRRGSLAVAMVVECVGAIIFGTSNSFAQAVAASTIMGAASAVQELTAIAAVAEFVAARQRGLFLALNIAMSIFFVPAFLYAQLLRNGSDWRWLLWIDLIWNGLTTIALSFSYFRMKVERLSRPTNPVSFKQFDWIGMVLLTGGLTIFLVGLQSGGQGHAWDSAYVLVQLILGVMTIIVFICWESRDIGRPLIPFRLFRGQRVVGLCLFIGIFSSVLYASSLNIGPTITQTVFSFSPIGYGVLSLGAGLGLTVGAVGTNILLTVIGQYAREILTCAAVFMTAFVGSEAVINPTNPVTVTVLSSFAALGIGSLLVPLTTLVTLACPEDLIGTAIALAVTCRTAGGTIGYAILYNIFVSKSSKTIPEQMAPRLVAAGLPPSSVASFIKQYVDAVSGGNLQDIPQASAAILDAAQEGFQWGTSQGARLISYASIPFGVVAIVLAMSLPSMKKYMTDRVLVRTKGE